MGIEKHGSKHGGGYVGGFLQLFDWNAKSRKKLFSSKSDLSEQSKQKKRSDGNLPMTRFNLVGIWLFSTIMDEDEFVAVSSIKGSSDYSCASSVTDEDGYGTRAPGVVARLMGLDSMPTSNTTEPFSTPFFDSQSLRDAHCHRRKIEFHHDHQSMHSGNLHNKAEVPIQKAMEPKEPKPLKMVNRPIEKFQTEILPPKSAKSIPITHHKLLSPIKSPGFIPHKNAAHIMEAAAKIIEPTPPVTTTKVKMPLLGTPSVPLKVRDLKEKAEASQQSPSRPVEASSSRRPVESNAAKFLKGQSMNKSLNGSVDTTSFRIFSDSEDCSSVKNKGKSISLALQAKVNVQRREGLSASSSRSSFGQKEQGEAISSQTFKSQTNGQKSSQKKPSAHNASSVLRQNNQKQNCLNDKEKLPSKSSLSNSQGRKVLSGDSSVGRHKNLSKFGGNSKVGSRKLGPEVTANKKEVSYSSTKNVPRKKRSIDGNFLVDKSPVIDSMLVGKTEKPIQSKSVVDRHLIWAEDSKRKGTDVVSFTFTSPLTRSASACEISRQVPEKNNGFCSDYRGKKLSLNSDSANSTKLSSPGHNVSGADALSILLEQKLRELTHGVESSCYKAGTASYSASIFQDLVSIPNAESTIPKSHDKMSQGMDMDKLGGHYSSIFSSTDSSLGFMTKLKLQVTEEMDDCSSYDTEARKLLPCRHPSPISVLEHSFFTESCNSSDSADSNSIEGIKQSSSVQAQEVLGMSNLKTFHLLEADAELSDSASSTSTRTVARRNQATLTMTNFEGSAIWELEYVKEILFNVELMYKDFTLGRAREIVNPHLFDQLENRKEVLESEGKEPKLRRKVLFDCVSECMDLRCRRYANGGSKTWAKGLSTLRRKDRLAQEVYKEISSWRDLGDCMVDDLVDKDMSSNYGKWLDFEVEAFEIGVEIEGQILNSLVNELVADIFLL
ncbi:hypothetical protein TEA_022378 [Camellia sinensis var. sinensis]|uniref:DUF4378 domain-containing protein n=1 Tax=Camellia sinensis var. sinensis TaxID=542762 RepID=A0A4S4EIE5_CAMSN|nr:hypothetical protein TEA_022378 [Camellia sinensis var. sinensis]